MTRERTSRGRREGGGSRSRRKASRAARTLFEISAGGVVYKRTRGGIAVCLISTRGGTRWQLPKGKREAGETLEQTAAREVSEETGLVARVGPRLDKIELWYTWTENGESVRHHKLVYFYLLEFLRGSTRDHDDEVHDARWFPAEEALARLTFPSERRALTLALQILGAEDAAEGTSRAAADAD